MSKLKHLTANRFLLPFACLLGASLTALATEDAMPPSAGFEWFPFLGPFHTVFLHLPIGFVLMAFILDIYSFIRPSDELRRAVSLVWVFSALSAVVAITLGLIRAEDGGYDAATLSQHQNYGIIFGVLTILTLVAHHLAFRNHAEGSPRLVLAYRGLMLVNLGMLTIAGHYGGNLTHGSGYLTSNAPGFVKSIVAKEKHTAKASPAEGSSEMTPQEKFFVDVVRPIFDAKCKQCHGPEKQKGDYTLYDPEIAIKGGSSGYVGIEPGNPLESSVVELIVLPEDDDNVMPPACKERLTHEEIGAIVKWVADGAVFPK